MYILAFSFPAAADNPECKLSLQLDTTLLGGSFTIINGGEIVMTTYVDKELAIELDAGSQTASTRMAINNVPSLSGTISVINPLTTNVTLNIAGGPIIATLAAGAVSETFLYTFAGATPVYTEDEVIAAFHEFSGFAAREKGSEPCPAIPVTTP